MKRLFPESHDLKYFENPWVPRTIQFPLFGLEAKQWNLRLAVIAYQPHYKI